MLLHKHMHAGASSGIHTAVIFLHRTHTFIVVISISTLKQKHIKRKAVAMVFEGVLKSFGCGESQVCYQLWNVAVNFLLAGWVGLGWVELGWVGFSCACDDHRKVFVSRAIHATHRCRKQKKAKWWAVEWKSYGRCGAKTGFRRGRDGAIEIQQGDIKIQRSKWKIWEWGQEGSRRWKLKIEAM